MTEGLRLANLRADCKTGKRYWVYISRYTYATPGGSELSKGSSSVLHTPLAGVYGTAEVRTKYNGRVPLAHVFDTEAEALDFARLKLEDEIKHQESILRRLQSDHAKCVAHLREKQKEEEVR